MPSPTRTGSCPTWPCGRWSRSGRSTPAWMRSTAPIARAPSAPCGPCTSRRPSRGSSRSWPRPARPRLRRDILATLVRLYHREADYQGSWWGIRPDTTGPYYDPREWECSGRIASVLKAAVLDGDAETVAFLRGELARQRVRIKGLPADSATDRPKAEEEIRVVIAKADPKNPDQIGNMAYEAAARRALQAKGRRGARQGRSSPRQSCRACHTDADGQTPKGPHLVDIGKRYSPAELVESILKPSAKIAQGYEAYSFAMADGRVFTGFVVSEGASAVQIRESSGALQRAEAGGHRGTPAAGAVGDAGGDRRRP